jgi:hypothetical protein
VKLLRRLEKEEFLSRAYLAIIDRLVQENYALSPRSRRASAKELEKWYAVLARMNSHFGEVLDRDLDYSISNHEMRVMLDMYQILSDHTSSA